MSAQTLTDRRAAVFARATDEALFGAVIKLERKANGGAPLTEAENLTRGWILTELEQRHPEVEPVMDAWAAADEPWETYTSTLMAAVAALAPSAAEVPAAPKRDLAGEIRAKREEYRAVKVRRDLLAARYPGRIHLICHGTAVAIPAGDVKAGDVLLYNYGSTAVVVGTSPKGKGSVIITTEDGYARTARRTTLVPIANRPDANL